MGSNAPLKVLVTHGRINLEGFFESRLCRLELAHRADVRSVEGKDVSFLKRITSALGMEAPRLVDRLPRAFEVGSESQGVPEEGVCPGLEIRRRLFAAHDRGIEEIRDRDRKLADRNGLARIMEAVPAGAVPLPSLPYRPGIAGRGPPTGAIPPFLPSAWFPWLQPRGDRCGWPAGRTDCPT
jgi:hypothetical protein